MKFSTLKIAALFILLPAFFTPSCLEDLGVDDFDCGCQNGAICIENTCDCPPGYTGVYCETYIGTPTENCSIAQQALSENQIRAALQSFTYDGTAIANISEAREMLKHICPSVNLHVGDNGYVCARFSNGKHITIWIDSYGKAGTYGFRYNNTDNHTHFSSNNSYFEITKVTNSDPGGNTGGDPGGNTGGNNPPVTNKMVVAIALERKDCGVNYYYTNPIYSYFYGTASNSALTESAKNWINQHYSGHESISPYYSEGKGNYVVIISTNKSSSPSCPRVTLAVGFGQNRNEALTKAQESLYGLNWYWNHGDPFTVVLDRTF